MKERLTRNLGLKLISLFCAFFVWLAVVNVANPWRPGTKEVQVEFINEQILEQANLTYEIVGKKTAVVSYRIKTKDAYKISESDFYAYADLADMYDVTGAIPIKVEVLSHRELLYSQPTVKPEVVKIQTEELQTKPFKLQANPYGETAKEYVPGEVTMTPDIVYVKGPISAVGQISSVGIEFPIEGAASDVAGTAQPVFYDANGNRLENLGDSVKAQSGDISYSMQILKVKNLPIDFVVAGKVAEGYRYTGLECSVKEVPVAGLKSALASLSTLTVQSPTLSIEGATGDKVCEIDLSQYLEPNIQIAGMTDTRVKVTLKVEPLEDRVYPVATRNITFAGAEEYYDYSIVNSTAEVKVRGLKEDLDSLSVDKMEISVEVDGLETGTHEVSASLTLDEAYEIQEYPICQVLVEEKAGQPGSGPAETSPEGETAQSGADQTEDD